MKKIPFMLIGLVLLSQLSFSSNISTQDSTKKKVWIDADYITKANNIFIQHTALKAKYENRVTESLALAATVLMLRDTIAIVSDSVRMQKDSTDKWKNETQVRDNMIKDKDKKYEKVVKSRNKYRTITWSAIFSVLAVTIVPRLL